MSNHPDASQQVAVDLKVNAQYLPDGRIAVCIMISSGVMQSILVASAQDFRRLARIFSKLADDAPIIHLGGNANPIKE